MIWPSKYTERGSRHGFALLEALISVALVALTMGAVMVTLAQSSTNQRVQLDRLLLSEFAHSKLEEWVVEGQAATDIEGTAAGGWNWRIKEVVVAPNPPSTIDANLGYSEITVQVWTDLQPDQVVDLRTLVARRLK